MHTSVKYTLTLTHRSTGKADRTEAPAGSDTSAKLHPADLAVLQFLNETATDTDTDTDTATATAAAKQEVAQHTAKVNERHPNPFKDVPVTSTESPPRERKPPEKFIPGQPNPKPKPKPKSAAYV